MLPPPSSRRVSVAEVRAVNNLMAWAFGVSAFLEYLFTHKYRLTNRLELVGSEAVTSEV